MLTDYRITQKNCEINSIQNKTSTIYTKNKQNITLRRNITLLCTLDPFINFRTISIAEKQTHHRKTQN